MSEHDREKTVGCGNASASRVVEFLPDIGGGGRDG